MHHDDFEKKKREKEFEEFKRRNQEFLDRHLDELAQFLLDLWREKEGMNNDTKDGSSPKDH